MEAEKISTSEIAVGLLGQFPPSLRASVLAQSESRNRFDLSVDAVVRLDQAGMSFKRSLLFAALRTFLASPTAAEIEDTAGQKWNFDSASADPIRLTLGERSIRLPDFSCLNPSAAKRLDWFDRESKNYLLNDSRASQWREILASREIDDEEVDELLTEIRYTPRYAADAVANHFREEELHIGVLVPPDARYFDRLVGAPGEHTRLSEFVEAVAKPLIRQLLAGNPFEGLKRALLLSSHPWFAKAIDLTSLPRESVLRFYEWLGLKGDRISQIGGLEVGLQHLAQFPELDAVLQRMTRQFLGDDPADENGRLKLFCSLVVLVDGELGRIGILKDRPPFWRRLAAFAQASMLERAVIARGLPAKIFSDWAMLSRGPLFYMQTFADMRTEPRWLPDFILPKQLKAELIGRLFGASKKEENAHRSPELQNLIFGEEQDSAFAQFQVPFSFLPGPLEGGIDSLVAMPTEQEQELRLALEAETVTPGSFVRLVNSALIYRLGPQLAALAAQALRRAKYQVRQSRSPSETFLLLSGLATVAAVTRSKELADEVRVLTRVVRRRPENDIRIESAWRIALIAAAAHSELNSWCRFAGEWLTELSFEDMPRGTAANLREHIVVLCKVQPQLWETCGRAEAACTSYVASSPA